MLLILVALLVGVANQMLPMVESHPEQIAAWLTARVGEPVSFSSARGEWTRRGPRFTLEGLHIGEGPSQLDIGRAQLQVAVYSGLLPGQPLTELKIRELALTLVQGNDGRWEVVGLPGQGGAVDPLDRLEGFGELQIEKAKLAIRAPRLNVDMRIPRTDARIRVDGPRLRVGVSAWLDVKNAPVSAVLDFQRRRNDGVLWAGGDKLVLSHWAPLFAAIGIVPQAGVGELAVWARISDRRISQVTLKADIAKARFRSAVPLQVADGQRRAARVDFDRLQASARWVATDGGWRMHAPLLNVSNGDRVAHLDGLRLEGGERFGLHGKELDLSPLAAMLALSDRFPDRLRLFLLQSNPQAVLRDVEIHGRRNGRMHGSLVISDLTLLPYLNRPGLSGVAGRIQFDEAGGVMRLSSTPVNVTWPAALRQPLDVRLGGTLALWKNGQGWTLDSSVLRIKGSDFGARARVQIGFQGDASAPILNLAADLDPATFQTAKKFWILNKMPAATVRWLDEALVSGEIINGRIAIGGDLDDWPFRNHTGTLDARARIANATLKFNDQWPAAKDMDLELAFDGPGFSLEGRGILEGNEVSNVRGGIADFHQPWLDLDIDATSSGEQLRQLMILSPLNKEYGEHLRAVTISGKSAVEVILHLPLRQGLGERSIEGTLDLADATLADSRWDLRFTQVKGRTRFSHRGFETENLSVQLLNQPGVFNLRVGDTTGDAKLAAVATLDGRFTAATLIDRYVDLAWLKPWVSGSSNWKLVVRIPPSLGRAEPPPSQLRLTSDLVGIAVTMPAPLKKPEQDSLALELQMALPIEKGDLNLRLGNLMRIRGQIRKDAPINGTIQFGDGPLAASPAQGLSIRGIVPVLDSTGWVAFAGKGESNSTVSDIDVQATRLIFIDRPFADARLQLRRGPALTQIVLKGAGIDGSIDVPNEISRGVQGRFATMHLPSDETVAGAAEASTVVVDDPAALPPLRFTFADLRIGQAQLGRAELVTTPTAAGMRVDRLHTEAKNLRLDAAGEWIRSPGGSRSNFRLDFNAASLGQMLDALGYGDIVDGGKTKATLAGSWPGSPGAFSLATLSGTLKAEVGEGRLLDVEPGGSGRILGLLSLAEIPRRLSLDFSDFFKKGFAFNSVKGDFVFNGGKARTDNLRIDGPAAEIRVTGATGLREMVYDQRVEVLPKAGGLLPAIGLLAAGPAGAAVGAVAQAVLQRPLKQTTRVVYRVTGPWQKPIVKVIEKGPSREPVRKPVGDSPTAVQP